MPIFKKAINRLARRPAYKIITNPDVASAGGATNKTIFKSLFRTPTEDDNKRYFLYGVDRPETNDGQAYSWNRDIQENGYKDVRSYQGILNPYNEYVFNSRDAGLVEALADANYSTVSNINDEYTDDSGYIARETPYFDDVHGYRLTFHRDNNGNPVISASDLYDFGKNYSDDFANIYEERVNAKNGKTKLELQRRLLNLVGQPYKLVQHNIPIRFTNNPQGSEIYRTNSITNQVLDNLSDEDISRITKSGFIKPSLIRR